MKKIAVAAAFLLMPEIAWAQGAVSQMQPAIPNHLPMYVATGIIKDAGGPTVTNGQPPNSNRPGSLPSGIAFVNGGLGVCEYSAYATGPYSSLCWGFDGSGNGQIVFDATQGAPNFELIVNGVNLPLPGSVNGMPFVASNSSLKALASTFSAYVMRADFTPGRGAPPVVYASSSSPCPIGGGDNGSQVPSSDGKCWLAQLNGVQVTPMIWGAIGDGATDDTVPLQAALNALAGKVGEPAAVGTLWIDRNYYSATGITTPRSGVILRGTDFLPSNPSAGSIISCPNTAPIICVLIDGGTVINPLQPDGIDGITILGVGATPAAGAIGVKWQRGYAPWAHNIKVTNFDTCGYWFASAQGGTSFDGENVNISKCTSHYAIADGWPAAHFHGGVFGDDGTGDFNAQEFVLFENTLCTTAGCGPNTWTFDAVQFNPGGTSGDTPHCAFRWAGLKPQPANGIVSELYLSNSHIEYHTTGVGQGVFCSDSSLKLWRFNYIHDNSFVLPTDVPLFAFDPATALQADWFEHNTFGGCTGITLAPAPASGAAIQDVWFTDNFGCNSFSITSNGSSSNRAFLTHNTWGTSYTIAGNWDGGLWSNDMLTGTTIHDSATGNVYMNEPAQTWTPTLNFGGASTGWTETKLGNYARTPTGGFWANFDVTVNAIGSATGLSSIDGSPLTCATANRDAAVPIALGSLTASMVTGAPLAAWNGAASNQILLEFWGTTNYGRLSDTSFSLPNSRVIATLNCTTAQ